MPYHSLACYLWHLSMAMTCPEIHLKISQKCSNGFWRACAIGQRFSIAMDRSMSFIQTNMDGQVRQGFCFMPCVRVTWYSKIEASFRKSLKMHFLQRAARLQILSLGMMSTACWQIIMLWEYCLCTTLITFCRIKSFLMGTKWSSKNFWRFIPAKDGA